MPGKGLKFHSIYENPGKKGKTDPEDSPAGFLAEFPAGMEVCQENSKGEGQTMVVAWELPEVNQERELCNRRLIRR